MLGLIGIRALDAQDKGSVVTLIPTAHWQLTSSNPVNASALGSWGGDAAIEHEYGVTSYTAHSYTFANHKADVLIEQAADPSSAYGLLTFYRTPAMTSLDGSALTVAAAGKALLARGPAFIRVSVSAPEALPLGDYTALLRLIGGPPPPRRALSQLPEPLPSRGLVDGSQKYVLGPIAAAKVLPALKPKLIGFDEGAELQTGTYRTGSSSGTLTLAAINYPTPQIARSEFDAINKALCQPGTNSFACRRRDTYVLIAMNAPSQGAADQFLKSFTVSKTISQDQGNPGDDGSVWQMLRLLIANGVLIMTLVVFSFAGGILVFVSKRLARKWFANSIFVEAEGAGIIILDLSDVRR
ncbi:MAG TPA: DUF6599 family protein [Terriglobia bacterium]|nr:DUF6599 family protein [Terriglobia bacterium]